MKTILLSLSLLLSFELFSQIWDQQKINFPIPSQGWRVRPVSNSVAFTFGYGIEPGDPYEYNNAEVTCQRSIDGGKTWISLPFKDTSTTGFICDVNGIDDQNFYVTYFNDTDGPEFYKTNDGGLTWSNSNAGVDVFLNWVYFFGNQYGIGFGDADDSGYFQFTRTSDGGKTWSLNDTLHSIKTLHVEEYGQSGEVYYNKTGHVLTVTFDGRLLHTMDNGISWEVIETPVPATGSAIDDSLNIYIGQVDNTLGKFEMYRGKYGSDDWIKITPENNDGYISGLSPVPGTNSVVMNVGVSGDANSFKTFASNNLGEHWFEVAKNIGLQYGFIEFFDSTTGYACEIPKSYELPSTNVFVYNGSPLTGLLSQHILDENIEFFPNPTADLINIKLTSEKRNDYWILINDAKGQLIEKIILNDVLSFEEQYSLKGLPVGNYNVTIASKQGYSTKSIIKSK